MKVVGNGRVALTTPADELVHEAGPHEDWQESVVLYIWDEREGCYAFLRIGREANRNGGQFALWINVWLSGSYVKHYATVPSEDGTISEAGFGGKALRYAYDGGHRWTIDLPELRAEFVMADSHPAIDFLPAQHNLAEVSGNHLEATGVVTGHADFRGRTIRLTGGIGHRDRSWGVRRWEAMRSHRWAPAIFGDDLITHAISVLGPDRSLHQFGYVIRDGILFVPDRLDILCHVETDGLTNRGGHVSYVLPGGDMLDVAFRSRMPAPVGYHRGYPVTDSMCTVTSGARTGVGIFESADNTLGGRERPEQRSLVGGYVEDGVFDYAPR